MDPKIRLLWAATMMLSIAAGSAQGRTINSSNSDGVDDGSSGCVLNPDLITSTCPPAPPPPPPMFSAACESTFQGPGSQDFDCSDYQQGAATSLLAAQGVLAQFKAVTPLDLYGNPMFAAPDFRTPNFGVLDALMGAGSGNAHFDAVFDVGTRQGQIKLLQRLSSEFMIGLGGTWGASGAETPWSAYFFFAASPDNIAGSEITFTLPARTADFTDFRLTGVSIFTPTQWVPEPGGLLLAGTALATLLAVSRRRRPAPGSASGAAPAAESAAAPPRR